MCPQPIASNPVLVRSELTMAIFKIEEIRNMSEEEIAEELRKLQSDLVRERGIVTAGGAPEKPGRIKDIRRTIARIKTVQKERKA
jgi:large subunit ribosomal protein L29